MPDRELIELVHDDARGLLGQFLTNTKDPAAATAALRIRPQDDLGPEELRNSEGTVVAVAWETTGYHTIEFRGIVPTRNRVHVPGLTVVTDYPTSPLLYRYIDWTYVLGQLGIPPGRRPVVGVQLST